MGFLYSDSWFKILSFTYTNKTHKAHGKPPQILEYFGENYISAVNFVTVTPLTLTPALQGRRQKA